jgi:hypothetical protein
MTALERINTNKVRGYITLKKYRTQQLNVRKEQSFAKSLVALIKLEKREQWAL